MYRCKNCPKLMDQRQLEKALQISIETVSTAITNVVKYSTDTDFPIICKKLFKVDNLHEMYIETNKSLWMIAKHVYDVDSSRHMHSKWFYSDTDDGTGERRNTVQEVQMYETSSDMKDFFSEIEGYYLDSVQEQSRKTSTNTHRIFQCKKSKEQNKILHTELDRKTPVQNEILVHPKQSQETVFNWFEDVLCDE